MWMTSSRECVRSSTENLYLSRPSTNIAVSPPSKICFAEIPSPTPSRVGGQQGMRKSYSWMWESGKNSQQAVNWLTPRDCPPLLLPGHIRMTPHVPPSSPLYLPPPGVSGLRSVKSQENIFSFPQKICTCLVLQPTLQSPPPPRFFLPKSPPPPLPGWGDNSHYGDPQLSFWGVFHSVPFSISALFRFRFAASGLRLYQRGLQKNKSPKSGLKLIYFSNNLAISLIIFSGRVQSNTGFFSQSSIAPFGSYFSDSKTFAMVSAVVDDFRERSSTILAIVLERLFTCFT